MLYKWITVVVALLLLFAGDHHVLTSLQLLDSKESHDLCLKVKSNQRKILTFGPRGGTTSSQSDDHHIYILVQGGYLYTLPPNNFNHTYHSLQVLINQVAVRLTSQPSDYFQLSDRYRQNRFFLITSPSVKGRQMFGRVSKLINKRQEVEIELFDLANGESMNMKKRIDRYYFVYPNFFLANDVPMNSVKVLGFPRSGESTFGTLFYEGEYTLSVRVDDDDTKDTIVDE